MRQVTLEEAEQMVKKLNLNPRVVSPKYLQKGMQVELEHGTINKKTNVTKNDLTKTAKIALAHIVEFPDYYIRLEKMEKAGNKYWENKKKPQIFLKNNKK